MGVVWLGGRLGAYGGLLARGVLGERTGYSTSLGILSSNALFVLCLILADVLHSSTSLATTVSSSTGEVPRLGVGERWSDEAGKGLWGRR
jgi:hypothetical protein